ncbi:MAG: lamin tail domain-containing protein [Planctomycetes bacterium]|nr:lamin tail domain-containing protein [Planctomycetota bacterium]
MKDPSSVADTRGEWIELYNTLPWRVNIEGWVLADDSGSQVVLSNGGLGLRLAPGQYFVVGNSADTTLNGSVPVQHAYSGFVLGNGADQIVLQKPNGLVVDRVAYDDGVAWPDLAGRSISLTRNLHDAFSNDDGAQWCPSTTSWNASNPDTGTPGFENELCP